MKLGVVFPQIETPPDPVVIRDYAQTAEGLGYNYLLAYDHVLGANPDRPGGWEGRPYNYTNPFHEPFVLFGYLAGVTEAIELVTGVIILPQRQTALIAKQAAQVDVLSGGRLRLGIGVGWNDVEYEALNENFNNRGQRSAEQIELMRELWTKPLVTFKGKYHTVSDAGINPLPVQRPIPVWFGVNADAALRRMALLGDGWILVRLNPETAREKIALVHRYLEEAGRSPSEFGIDVWISICDHPQSEWRTVAEQWRDIGATHIAVNTMRAGFESPQQHLDAIQQFKEIVEDL